MGEGGKWLVWGRGEVYTAFWWKNLREGDHLKDLGVGWKITLIGSSRNRMEGR